MLKQKGFTLIEILIALAIVGVLVGVALPSYNGYVLKTKRSDCKAGLLRQSDLQERFYLRNNTYAPDTATLYGDNAQHFSPKEVCELTVTSGDANSFVSTATAQGAQVADTGCTILTLNHAGVEGTVPPGGDCW